MLSLSMFVGSELSKKRKILTVASAEHGYMLVRVCTVRLLRYTVTIFKLSLRDMMVQGSAAPTQTLSGGLGGRELPQEQPGCFNGTCGDMMRQGFHVCFLEVAQKS